MNPKTLWKISYGLYIVSSKKDDKFNGQIANTVFQVTTEPKQIAVCLNKQNLTHEFIQESRVFAVSILSVEAPMKFIGNFGFKSGRELDKFKGVNYKIGITGVPIVLENTIGYLEAKVIGNLDLGTHTIFIGSVIDAEIIKDEEPMTYEYYHKVKGGISPKTAPTYLKEEIIQKGESEAKKYICSICGYVYDPKKRDPDSGIKPGTPFEELPNSWVCPVCGAERSAFKKES